MENTWCLSVIISVLFLYMISKHFIHKFRGCPPRPFLSIPILGHLYLLKKPLHRTLAKVSNCYGSVIMLDFGSRPVLVVSSPAAAEECFTTNDVVFANRPKTLAGKYLGYNYTTVCWATYGPHWRNLRKIMSLEILSADRVEAFANLRGDEIRSLVGRLYKSSCTGEFKIADMKENFFDLIFNMVMRTMTGNRYSDKSMKGSVSKKFKEIVEENFQLLGQTNLGDFMPILNWFPGNKTRKRIEKLARERNSCMQEMIEEHRRKRNDSCNLQPESKTVLDIFLSLQETEPEYYTDTIIQGLMYVTIMAGTDTASGTLEWALTLLLNHPDALKKASDEIDKNVGSSRLMDDADLSNLPYLHAIVKETLRMCPVGPLIAPHESSEECFVGGFRVPRGTMLLVNVWAIQNDPKLWEEPDKFKPERFLEQEGRRVGLKFMPFGSGRRRCPGEGLAIREVCLALGTLLQCFEWERIGQEMVDMTEGPGLTMPKTHPLLAKYRPQPQIMHLLSHL